MNVDYEWARVMDLEFGDIVFGVPRDWQVVSVDKKEALLYCEGKPFLTKPARGSGGEKNTVMRRVFAMRDKSRLYGNVQVDDRARTQERYWLKKLANLTHKASSDLRDMPDYNSSPFSFDGSRDGDYEWGVALWDTIDTSMTEKTRKTNILAFEIGIRLAIIRGDIAPPSAMFLKKYLPHSFLSTKPDRYILHGYITFIDLHKYRSEKQSLFFEDDNQINLNQLAVGRKSFVWFAELSQGCIHYGIVVSVLLDAWRLDIDQIVAQLERAIKTNPSDFRDVYRPTAQGKAKPITKRAGGVPYAVNTNYLFAKGFSIEELKKFCVGEFHETATP